MQIALIGNEYKQQFPLRGYGGIESCVEQLAQGLHQAGIDFYVIVPKRQTKWWNRPPRYPFEVIEANFLPAALTGKRPAEFMQKVRDILLARPKPDIIWSQSEWSPPPLLDMGVPILTTLQGSAPTREPELMINHENVYYRFVSLSQYHMQIQEEWEKRHATQIYTGLSDEEYDFAPEQGDYFLWVAGLNWGWSLKGLDIFIQLAEINPDKKFLCFGSGDLKLAKKLSKISARMKNFTFGGELKRGRRHHKAFKNARAFMMLTRTAEACARTVLESLSKGTPVIGRNSGSVPEIVGSCGYCSNEVEELNTALGRTFSRTACFDHSQHFSVANEVVAMMKASEQILTGAFRGLDQS